MGESSPNNEDGVASRRFIVLVCFLFDNVIRNFCRIANVKLKNDKIKLEMVHNE